MTNFNSKQVILSAANSTDPPPTPEAGGLIPLLMYGGVAVAVIISMAYFSQILLKSITDMLKTLNKKPK